MTAPTYYRVSPRFWTNPETAPWPDDVRLLALYLLTSPHRTTEGLFRLPRFYVAGDLRWTPDRVAEAWRQLVEADFIAEDNAAGVVLIVNALAWQPPEAPNHITAAMRRIRDLPPTALLDRFYKLSLESAPKLAAALRREWPGKWSDAPAPARAERQRDPEEADPTLAGVPTAEELFEAFWIAYPRRNGKRIGKGQALAVWRRMKPGERAAATLAVEHYRTACEDPRIFVGTKDAHRWLRNREWEDWQEPATPDEPKGRRQQGEMNRPGQRRVVL